MYKINWRFTELYKMSDNWFFYYTSKFACWWIAKVVNCKIVNLQKFSVWLRYHNSSAPYRGGLSPCVGKFLVPLLVGALCIIIGTWIEDYLQLLIVHLVLYWLTKSNLYWYIHALKRITARNWIKENQMNLAGHDASIAQCMPVLWPFPGSAIQESSWF